MNPVDKALWDEVRPFHPASSPDFIPQSQLRGLQSQRLRQQVARAYEHIAPFRQRMTKRGLTPDDIGGLADLVRLPLACRDDLCGDSPFGSLAVNLRSVARMHTVDRIPGKPIVVCQTRRDLDVWHELLVRSLACCGLRPGDVVLNACGPASVNEAIGLSAAAETLETTVVPSAAGDADRQIAALKDLGISAILCSPSRFLYLCERAEKTGVAIKDLSLRLGIFFGEPWSEELRCRVEQAGIQARGLYGVPEILGPGIGAECCEGGSLHLFEDHFYPEIIDPDTGEPVRDGQDGELVLTALSREAMPLVRYRTSARSAILPEPCSCGRTLRRVSPVEQRSEQTVLVQGVQVFPSQVESVLAAVEGGLPPYRIAMARRGGVDRVEVQVEVTPQIFRDQVGAMEGLQNRLAQEIERVVGVRVPVRFVEPHAITRSHIPPRPSID